MKVSTCNLSILLITLLSAATFASPVPQGNSTADPDAIPTNGASAPHSSDGAAVINPGVERVADVKITTAARSQKCIKFSTDNPNWRYRNDGPWKGEGYFGFNENDICVDRSDTTGGAMFISTGSDTPAGSTKLECYFPTSGKANCDVSLVDGYSLSVTCHTAKWDTPTIGGKVNLWKTGAGCEDQSLKGSGICKNDKGYARREGGVSPFFQHAIQGDNNYCIWVNCKQDYYFDVDEDLYCHVSGGILA